MRASRVFLRGSVAAVAALVACALAGPALADGGKTIASAPELPVGTHVVGGANAGDYGEFWRLTVNAGDQITFDYGTTNTDSASIYVYRPSVTDNTYPSARTVASDSTYAKSQLKWTATGRGAWVIQFYCACRSLGYDVTVSVERSNDNQSSGATTIAAAPQLPLATHLASGAGAGDYGEFWRLTLNAGDQVTFDFGTLNNESVSIYVYRPSVTDNTYNSARSITNSSTYDKGQMKWTATGQGPWLIQVYCACSSLGYDLTANVVRSTANQSSGATSIAAAPQLPLQATIVSGAGAGPYGEFWRVSMKAGDVLTIEYATVNSESVEVSVFKPDVTDNTFGDSNAAFSQSTSSSARATWRAPSTGAWLVRVDCECSSLGYAIGIKVQTPTTLSVRAPSATTASRAFTVSGVVSRGASGNVTLTFTAPGRRAVKVTAAIGGSGSFSASVKLPRGSYTVRATYGGDDSHLGSTARTTSVRVR
jgi:hypothetical protein